MNLTKILTEGVYVNTSGTSGNSKPIWQSREKIRAANITALEVQGITPDSRVYTVCTLDHAGGLLAQTLPAHFVGANTTIDKFNPRTWCDEIQKYTHCHLTPRMAESVIRNPRFAETDLTDKVIVCGSDPVDAWVINKFTAQGATFIVNWGMTEVGPIAINKTFKPGDTAENLGKKTIMGDTSYCDWDIDENGQLWVRGDICVYNGWFPTGDLVEYHNGCLYYGGRI